MKSTKMNGLGRLFTFVLIAVILVCVVGFAVGGLQLNNPQDTNSGDIGNNTENTDDDKDLTNNTTNSENESNNTENSQNNQNADTQTEIKKYYNTLTGVEISEEQSKSCPFGFVIDSSMPLYGISNSDITFEFPIEDGKSRFLSYSTNTSALWKIGSLSPTRAYISFTSNLIGGIVVSYGNDDIIKYSAWDASKIDLDISEISDCYYVENTLYIYTGKELVDKAHQDSEGLEDSAYKAPPYVFSDTKCIGSLNANSVTIPYSDKNETELIYSPDTEKYLLYKSGSRRIDMLNGKNIAFTNLFILFANTTTYENSSGTELVLDNTSGGSGFYISCGGATEIRWSVNEDGSLEFRGLDGEILSVNRGNSYIGYFKASQALKIKIN